MPRRSPRQKGKTCGRPFKAPRPVIVLEDSDVLLIATDVETNKDSEVEVITETENQRDLKARYEAQDNSSDSEDDIPVSTLLRQEKEGEERQDITKQKSHDSDTTASTPDIFKSPVREVVQTMPEVIVESHVVQERSLPFTYEGITHVPETEQQENSPGVPETTEQQDNSSDSEDDIPVSTLLRQEKGVTLTAQQIKDCTDRP